MNIIWVEDLADEHLAGQLFNPVIEANAAPSISDWMGANDFGFTPAMLEGYFKDNICEHRVTLCTNIGDYLDRFATCDISREADVFIIDINLTNSLGPGNPIRVPEGYSNGDFPHDRAGLYIYNHLVARQFPRQRICLMTGEDTTLSEYQQQCAVALMEPPQSFHKSESSDRGYPWFHKWLKQYAEDDQYLRFRRSALNGISWVRILIVLKKSEGLPFRGYLDRKQQEHFSENDAKDYLNGLEALLPAAVRDRNEESAILRTFLRALAHEWEDRARPLKKRHIPLAFATANAMKLSRNCLSHGRLLDSIRPKDLAILFIFGFRAMFGLPGGELRHYERDLLNLFGTLPYGQSKVEASLRDFDDSLRKRLNGYVREGKLSRERDDKNRRMPRSMRDQHPPGKDGSTRPFTYSDVVKELSMAEEPIDLPFPVLVISTFWLTLLENRKLDLFAPTSSDKWAIDFQHGVFAHYFVDKS